MAVAGKLSEPRRLRQYLRRKLRAPKASASGRRVGRDGHLTNRQFCERAKCVERFWLQSVSLGNRLLAASGFKYVRCNGSLTYPRKPAGSLPIEWVWTRREDSDAQFPAHDLRGRRRGPRYGRRSCQR